MQSFSSVGDSLNRKMAVVVEAHEGHTLTPDDKRGNAGIDQHAIEPDHCSTPPRRELTIRPMTPALVTTNVVGLSLVVIAVSCPSASSVRRARTQACCVHLAPHTSGNHPVGSDATGRQAATQQPSLTPPVF